MRLSVESSDAGYEEWCRLRDSGKTILVYLDDAEVRDVVTVDDEAGMVKVEQRVGDDFVLDCETESIATDTLHGNVRIEVTD